MGEFGNRQTDVACPEDEALGQKLGDIEGIIDMMIAGRYHAVPPGQCRLSGKLKELAGRLEGLAQVQLKQDVSMSVNVSEAVTEIAGMMRDIHEVDHRSQTIAAASEQLVHSVNEISKSSNSAAAEARLAHETAVAGHQSAERAVAAMATIAGAVEEAMGKVEALAQASAQIGGIVNQIEAIAKQTNLLALNATIEAARAGEAGKGFAVVATEVKHLANQTAKATEDIRSRIEHLRQEMGDIVRSMEGGARAVEQGQEVIHATGGTMGEMAEQVAQVTRMMGDIAAILSQQTAASAEVADGVGVIAEMSTRNVASVSKVADMMDASSKLIAGSLQEMLKLDIPDATIHVAKSDHMIWRKRLADMLVGRESLNPDELADHTSCRLGKWCANLTDPSILNHPAFAQMAEPHRLVHMHGIEAAKRFKAGDLVGAVECVNKAAEASKGVMAALEMLGERGKF
ncbi:MAG TPA: methyl-accepting chemotaxis protein [Magnetospirillum sp.]|jgi:methyl-accepting chemotaxis protein|nr:methyl-accepting chemotaxis protein [Magnetospirillum sp.]